MSRIVALTAAILALVTCFAGEAQAMAPAGSGEATFTKGTSNIWYFSWTRPQASGPYKICWSYFIDGHEQSGPDGPCEVQNTSSGTISKSHDGLLDGHSYEVFATGYQDQGAGYQAVPGDTAGTVTRIDNSPPTLVEPRIGTPSKPNVYPQYTNNANMPLRIYYSDATSPPWPSFQSTSDCWSKGSAGGACLNNPGHGREFKSDPACGNPNSGFYSQGYMNWTCSYDTSAFASDGKWFYCVNEADSAIPDSPPETTIFTPAQANHSLDAPAAVPPASNNCWPITLDRSGPVVTAQADHANVNVGGTVNLSASANDALSGISGTYGWTFGDGAPNAAGSSVSHTYTQPGTYHATATTNDGAGNQGAGSVTITVAKPSTLPSAPNTKISKALIGTKKKTATFRFKSTGSATKFECSLTTKGKAHYSKCRSPKTYKTLKSGKYTFLVRAVGPGGPDRSPARKTFKIP